MSTSRWLGDSGQFIPLAPDALDGALTAGRRIAEDRRAAWADSPVSLAGLLALSAPPETDQAEQ